MELNLYYKMVNEAAAQIPTDVTFITSIENPFRQMTGGITFEVFKKSAARNIISGTHRIATTDEIQQWRVDQLAREQECLREEYRKAQKHQLVSTTPAPAEMATLLAKIAGMEAEINALRITPAAPAPEKRKQ